MHCQGLEKLEKHVVAMPNPLDVVFNRFYFNKTLVFFRKNIWLCQKHKLYITVLTAIH